MRTEHTYFEKIRSGRVSSTDTFGVVTLDFPAVMPLKAKAARGKSFHGSDGDEVVEIDMVRYEAFEFTAKFGYKGPRGTGVRAMMDFINFLAGRSIAAAGINMRVASGITGMEYNNVRFVSFAPELAHMGDDGDIMTFSVTFRVGDPNIQARASFGADDVNMIKVRYREVKRAHDWSFYYVSGGKDIPIVLSTNSFGLYATDAPAIPSLKAKQIYTNNWPDEDGEQIFDNGRLDFESFDYSVKFASVYASRILDFVSIVRSSGGSHNMKIVDNRSGITYYGAYLGETAQDKYGITQLSDQTSVAELKFRINEIVSW